MSKELYSFSVEYPITERVEEKSFNEAGEEIIKIVNKKTSALRKITINKPSRKQNDEAELIKAKKYSKFLSDGILSRSMLLKKHSDNGGIITKLEQETYAESLIKIREIEIEIQKFIVELNVKEEKDLTDEQSAKLSEFSEKIKQYQEKINDIEEKYQNEFSNTAEALAERERVKYLIFTLTEWQVSGKTIPMFEGKTFEERYESYCKLEDADEESEEYKLYQKCLRKINIFLTYYAQGKALKKEHFEFLEKKLDEEVI